MHALRRLVNEALEARKRHETIAPLPAQPVAATDPPEPEQQTRGGYFARELGDAWVEVEPGIYERAA